ncbi:hypothetical protein ACHHYP_05698, partial [Achlya hypogyna]
SEIQSRPVTVDIQAITGYSGVSTYQIVSLWTRTSLENAQVQAVVAESVDTVTVSWQPGLTPVQLVPVTLQRTAFSTDVVYPSMADVQACIGAELVALGYSISTFTVATTDASFASLDVAGVPVATSAADMGLAWTFNGSEAMPALVLQPYVSGTVSFSVEATATRTATTVVATPLVEAPSPPLLITVQYLVDVVAVAQEPVLSVAAPSSSVAFGFAAPFVVSCALPSGSGGETFAVMLSIPAAHCSGVAMVYMFDTVLTAGADGCSYVLRDNTGATAWTAPFEATVFLRAAPGFSGNMTVQYTAVSGNVADSTAHTIATTAVLWEADTTPTYLPTVFLWLESYQDEVIEHDWHLDMLSAVAASALVKPGYGIMGVHVECDVMNPGVQAMHIDDKWVGCGAYNVSDLAALAVLPAQGFSGATAIKVAVVLSSPDETPPVIVELRYAITVHAVTAAPSVVIDTTNMTVPYGVPGVITVVAATARNNSWDALAVTMRVWNCSGIASVVVTGASGADVVTGTVDAVADVCEYVLSTAGAPTQSLRVNLSAVDAFFGWTPIEVTATATAASGASTAATVVATTLLWMPDTTPVEVVLPATNLTVYEDEVVFLASSDITAPIVLPADYAMSFIQVVSDGVWIQGICGPCNESSAMGDASKQFDGDWTGVIGVVPAKHYSGAVEFGIDIMLTSPVLGHRPVVYHRPYAVDVVAVAIVPQLTIAPYDTSVEYGAPTSVWVGVFSDDPSQAVRVVLRPRKCDGGATVLADGTLVPLTWTGASDCVHELSRGSPKPKDASGLVTNGVASSNGVINVTIAMPDGYFGLTEFDVVATSTSGASSANIVQSVAMVWLPNPAAVYEPAVVQRRKVFAGVAVDVDVADIVAQVNASMLARDYVGLGYEIVVPDATGVASMFTVSPTAGITEVMLDKDHQSLRFTDFGSDVRAGV